MSSQDGVIEPGVASGCGFAGLERVPNSVAMLAKFFFRNTLAIIIDSQK